MNRCCYEVAIILFLMNIQKSETSSAVKKSRGSVRAQVKVELASAIYEQRSRDLRVARALVCFSHGACATRSFAVQISSYSLLFSRTLEQKKILFSVYQLIICKRIETAVLHVRNKI